MGEPSAFFSSRISLFISLAIYAYRKIKKTLSNISDPTAPLSDFGIEVHRAPSGLSVSVSGVVSVFELSCAEIGILTARARISVCGDGLLLSVFESRRVEVVGRVGEISFKYGKG